MALNLPTPSPIVRISASDQIAQTLREAIVEGKLPTGELLRQDQIATQFRVSKIPVREALKRLEAERLVTFIPNRGAIVASLTPTEILQYIEIRALLEAHAAHLAASRITDENIEIARAASDAFDSDGPDDLRSDSNRKFHMALYADANRPVLLSEIQCAYDKVERHLRSLPAAPGDIAKTRREHSDILKAFAQRAPLKAADLIRAHVLRAGSLLGKN